MLWSPNIRSARIFTRRLSFSYNLGVSSMSPLGSAKIQRILKLRVNFGLRDLSNHDIAQRHAAHSIRKFRHPT